MIEARIICLSHFVNIVDMNLTMQKGQGAWVDEVQARSSKDLERYRQIGAVSVAYVEKPHEIRPAKEIPAISTPVEKPNPPKFIKQSVEVLNLEDLSQKIADKINQSSDRKIEALTSQIEALKSLILRNPVKVSNDSKAIPGIVEKEEVFMPSSLVSNQTIKVEGGNTVTSSPVEEALKALKKNKK